MKKLLFPSILALATLQVQAQDFFALTGQDSKRIIFQDFRVIDLDRGESGEIIFGQKSSADVISQKLNTSVKDTKASYHSAQATNMATLAYDASGNNLVYAPMFSSNIYVLNARTKQIQLIENEAVVTTACDINSHLTRMATGYDGNIYAINNASTQFIKISNENGRYEVQDLGAIREIATNKDISLYDIMTGFGGDMIADADNNFYLFSSAGNVFKLVTNELTAEYVGTVKGLPEGFTLNGAAVNKEGMVIVASAKAEGFYEFDIHTLEAKKVNGELTIPVYDLASNYFVNDHTTEETLFTGIEINPTKVSEQTFNVEIANESVRGNLKVEVINYLGNKIATQELRVTENGKYPVRLNGANQGVYIVNIADKAGNTLLSQKILVTR